MLFLYCQLIACAACVLWLGYNLGVRNRKTRDEYYTIGFDDGHDKGYRRAQLDMDADDELEKLLYEQQCRGMNG